MDKLLARFRHTGFLFIVGVIVIIYVALGILYFQQAPRQKKLTEQTVKLLTVRALPGPENLKAELEEVNHALTPMPIEAVLEILVSMAKESGINVDPKAKRLNIPHPVKEVEEKVGVSKYQVLPFRGVKVQGDYDKVMAFIAKLDTHEALKTMALKKVDIGDIEIPYEGEEAARRKEFREVIEAVAAMMKEIKLASIPNPQNYEGKNANNDMTAFPDAISAWVDNAELTAIQDAVTVMMEANGLRLLPKPVTEATNDMAAFPDTISEVVTAEKYLDPSGKNYDREDKNGYVLYEHDIIADNAQTDLVNYVDTRYTRRKYTVDVNGTVKQVVVEGKTNDLEGKPYVAGDKEGYVLVQHDLKADGSQKDLASYITTSRTRYFYTAEANGQVRQFDKAVIAEAQEFLGSNGSEIETLATLDIDLYVKLPEAPKPAATPPPQPAPKTKEAPKTK